jgi:1-phosphatidylinositol-4-phosphate 5-kinase
VKQNPHTLLCRFFGLHRVKLPHGRKIHFVVMGNVFPPNRDIHETYDLKGSTLGRAISDEELNNNPRATQKDLNWVNRNRKLELGPEKRHLFVEQTKRDVELLARLNIMDYSLLIGIHDLERGNKDNIRDNTLKVFHVSLVLRIFYDMKDTVCCLEADTSTISHVCTNLFYTCKI